MSVTSAHPRLLSFFSSSFLTHFLTLPLVPDSSESAEEVSKRLLPAVNTSFRACFSELLIPAMERTTREMLAQVGVTIHRAMEAMSQAASEERKSQLKRDEKAAKDALKEQQRLAKTVADNAATVNKTASMLQQLVGVQMQQAQTLERLEHSVAVLLRRFNEAQNEQKGLAQSVAAATGKAVTQQLQSGGASSSSTAAIAAATADAANAAAAGVVSVSKTVSGLSAAIQQVAQLQEQQLQVQIQTQMQLQRVIANTDELRTTTAAAVAAVAAAASASSSSSSSSSSEAAAQAEIEAHLVAGNYEQAFEVALGHGKYTLVEALISTLDPKVVFTPVANRGSGGARRSSVGGGAGAGAGEDGVGGAGDDDGAAGGGGSGSSNKYVLSNMVILSLIQQLAFELAAANSKNPAMTGVRLAWLNEAIVALNPADQAISPHVPEILKEVITNIDQLTVGAGAAGGHQLKQSDAQLARIIRILCVGISA